MGKPKRHHFVPQFVIRNFARSDGRVWYLERTRADRRAELRSPSGVFWQRHLYSYRDGENLRDPAVERAYGQAESEWAPLIDRAVRDLRVGRAPLFAGPERRSLEGFFYHQFMRVPHQLNRVKCKEVERLDDALLDGPVPEESVEGVRLKLLDVLDNALIDSLVNGSDNIAEVFARKDLFFAVLANSKKSFVLGDVPIGRFHQRVASVPDSRLPLWDASVEMSMPIAPDIAIGFCGDGGGYKVFGVKDDSDVRAVNVATMRRSDAVCSRSDILISSLSSIWPGKADGGHDDQQ
ncbi:DUF4238 domain-containing protein [Maricaulis maris]|uniref:DUF4238 domain-containing protein n=1 Tax=Maricaulis maris TaxID=74318 RepID=UPI0026EEBB84|nr:DUF4238 domain-containing protein [Maricaulis maris]